LTASQIKDLGSPVGAARAASRAIPPPNVNGRGYVLMWQKAQNLLQHKGKGPTQRAGALLR